VSPDDIDWTTLRKYPIENILECQEIDVDIQSIVNNNNSNAEQFKRDYNWLLPLTQMENAQIRHGRLLIEGRNQIK